MSDLIDLIKDYLFNEQIRAIDVIIIGLIGSFILWLLRIIVNSVKVKLGLFKAHISKLHRRYIKRNMTVNEYIKAHDRVQNGEVLKWYEKKAYDKMQKGISKGMGTIKEKYKS
ncbi:hypothetical protein ACIQYG_20875 [Peribacillus sp. NPDC096622]|uniref:hypothetical protein n=1 Tax=Peribacillus sp. NPDC096622 TaxID=3364396 RepID=UPI00382A75A7